MFTLPKQIQIRQLVRFVTITLGSSVFPFMAMYYTSFFGTLWTGILMMLTSLAGFIATLYEGHLSDAIGRKYVIIIGSIGCITGWFIAILANLPNLILPWLTFVGILLVEIFSSFYAPAYEAMLIDLTEDKNRRFVYTINYWFINIAVMFGAGISGLFYDHYFLELLIALFLVALGCFFVAYYYFDETKLENHDFEHGSGMFASLKNYSQVLKDRAFVMFTIGSIFMASIWMHNYIPVHLKLHFVQTNLFGFQITSSKMLSLMVFTNTLLIVIFMTILSKVTENWPLLTQIIIGSLIFTIGIFLSFTFTHLLMIWLAVIIFTVGEMINVPANQLLRVKMMKQSKIGSYTGFISMVQPLGAIFAGLLVSVSYFTGKIGVQIVFLVFAFIGITLIVLSAKMKEKV
ncbi:MFS transporter [Streptococcus didelphis]|uniref:MFS transporter n=1 Tax=Streptococcus didelphis TaxID=102886 RepID=UPI0027D31688|nr:MFS transporter [Streptococcus didelphis]